MMFRFFFTVFLLIQPAFADDLFNILDSRTSPNDLDIGKKVQTLKNFRKLIKHPTAEQNIFFRFLSEGKVEKALYQWPLAFGNTSSFAAGDTGGALYGYLLFKNGLPLTGLEVLFTKNPRQIHPLLVQLWQALMQFNVRLWAITSVQWSGDWIDIFGSSAEIRVLARRFGSEPPLDEYEKLLRKTPPGSWERNWVQWRYITTLLTNSEDAKAAKLLKHLQGVTENNPVSKNLMNLTAARMLYQNGYLTESIRYYRKVKKGSDYWFEALEEMGWAELRLGQPQNALAHTQTLLNPDFDQDVGPGAFYLASLANLKVCDYQGVSKTIMDFKNRFQMKTKRFLKLQKQPDTPAVRKLFKTLTVSSGPVVLGGNLPRYMARDEHLYFLLQRQKQWDKEVGTAKKLYSRSMNQGIRAAGFQLKMEEFRNEVSARGRRAYAVVLDRVKVLVDQEIAEISGTLKKMQIVEVELIQQVSLLEKVIVDDPEKDSRHSVKRGTTGAKGKYAMSFIYQGERWFDELSSYQVNISGMCGSKGSL